MRRAWKPAALAAGMFSSLAACSSGSTGSADATLTSPASSETSVEPSSETSVEPTSSDVGWTSTGASTTTGDSTTTSTSPTTIEATTTTVPVDAVVKADFLALYGAYWECLRSPTTCDPTALTASVGPARDALSRTVADLASGGLFVGSEDPGYAVVQSVTGTGSATAVVVSCWWDTGVLYGPPAKTGGDPVIVNDLQVTSEFETTLQLEAGRWLTSDEKRTKRVEGENQCPPEG